MKHRRTGWQINNTFKCVRPKKKKLKQPASVLPIARAKSWNCRKAVTASFGHYSFNTATDQGGGFNQDIRQSQNASRANQIARRPKGIEFFFVVT